MNTFPLFLPDFRAFVRNKAFNSESNEHPVFYFEDDLSIKFYKPIGYIVYTTLILKIEKLPMDITDIIKELKKEATELPSQPDAPTSFSGTII